MHRGAHSARCNRIAGESAIGKACICIATHPAQRKVRTPILCAIVGKNTIHETGVGIATVGKIINGPAIQNRGITFNNTIFNFRVTTGG